MRDNYADNIKAVAIYMVVLSHCLMPLYSSSNEFIMWAYNCLFLIHMPLFFYVSGLFAKFNFKNILSKLLYPYILFQIIFILFAYFFDLSFFDHLFPFYSLWYLLSLSIYLFSVLLLKKVNLNLGKIIIILLSIVLALAFGFIKIPDYLGILSRTICLYPFFLFGFFYKQIKLNQIFQKKLYKIISFILIILTFVSTYFVFDSIDMDMIFYLSYDYTSIWFRLLRYVFSIILFISFLIIIPNNQKWYTCFGARTKTIYLYHVFLAISLSCAYDLYDNSVLKLFVMIIVAFLICLLTGNKWFVKYTKYTTEICINKKDKLKKQD